MELTREKAIELFRQMWTDMQKEFGDCPYCGEREYFKYRWCHDHTPEAMPLYYCYLCEYIYQIDDTCDNCPINWGEGRCVCGEVNYCYSPISEILSLPERKGK